VNVAPRWNAPERVPDALDTPGRLALLEETIAEAWLWRSFRLAATDCLRLAELDRSSRSLAERCARAALAFVQRLPYRHDPPGVDTYQGVAWTLAHGGDCEDLSALFVALLRALAGHYRLALAARVRWLARPGAQEDHITSEARCDGGAWRWAECSVRGALLGEYPPDAAARLAPHRAELFGGAIGGV